MSVPSAETLSGLARGLSAVGWDMGFRVRDYGDGTCKAWAWGEGDSGPMDDFALERVLVAAMGKCGYRSPLGVYGDFFRGVCGEFCREGDASRLLGGF